MLREKDANHRITDDIEVELVDLLPFLPRSYDRDEIHDAIGYDS